MNKQQLVRFGVGAATLVLAVTGFWAVSSDAFVAPKKVLGDGVRELMRANARQASLALRIQTGGDDLKKNAVINVVSRGVIERSDANQYAYDGSVEIKNHKPGIDLNFALLLRYLDQGAYLNLQELPGTAEIKDALLNKWLILSDRKQPLAPLTELEAAFQTIEEQKIISNVAAEKVEKIGGLSARKYVLQFDQEKARKATADVAKNEQASGFSKNVGARLSAILDNFNIEQTAVWVTPRDHRLIKLAVTLIPKNEKLQGSLVSLDLELLPVKGTPPVIETPPDPRKFTQTELLWRLVTVGLK